MALKFGHHQIDLSAAKKKEAHPGPFYQKFGFQSDPDWGADLAKYLSEHGNKTINMQGDSQEVATQTGNYISGKNWQFSAWRAN
jgi:hypothetical protein